jgi:hypothetical protein
MWNVLGGSQEGNIIMLRNGTPTLCGVRNSEKADSPHFQADVDIPDTSPRGMLAPIRFRKPLSVRALTVMRGEIITYLAMCFLTLLPNNSLVDVATQLLSHKLSLYFTVSRYETGHG